MITKTDRLFNLSTKATTYLFAVTETGHLEHLYYGRRLDNPYISIDSFGEKRSQPIGCSVAYDSDHPTLFLTNLCTEYSSAGKGEMRECSLDVEYGRGMQTLDFVYQSARVLAGKPRMFGGLPQAYGEKSQCTTVEVMLRDKVLPLRLGLTYTVFEESDVITRRVTLYNDSVQTVRINNIASLQLDLTGEWDLTTFDGAWARERYMHTRPITAGIIVNDSKSGVSSANHNPCIFLTN